ncbi:MAG: 30S ribosomal protein S17 [Candidatus Dadabacteria bacterium]|nr:30S ribosomal protein S17 [Candidatus Dadabacteria bacterium]MXZ13600.1 30S ribosomal protein S17 [Candidatus Dadabacteria bacterium]MYA48324.1 30S ribosomal protein S17 [Candidatus Dadabacteria bacterium]MYC39989.1 30S ribosomal protein S17 [Candidatus Dadabacteria bacterium]MYF47430.1 30S ribosomal protein S17 [Candidatus Dadabacteria bacterium]
MERGKLKTRTGVVVGNKMDKTAIVEVQRTKSHGRYKKQIRVSRKFKVHDERNECNIGDKVVIIESRPHSKTKRWRLGKVVSQGAGA